MRKRLIEMLEHCPSINWLDDSRLQIIADYLLVHGVIVPTVTCKNCTFYEPYEKVEDFDGRCCLMNGSEVDEDFYCKWGAKK